MKITQQYVQCNVNCERLKENATRGLCKKTNQKNETLHT